MQSQTEFSLKNICNQAEYHYQRLPNVANYIFCKATHTLSFRNKKLSHDHQLDGWRFFVSVHPDDIDRAWDVLTPILFDKDTGVLSFEFVNLYDGDDKNKLKHRYQLIIHTFADAPSSNQQNIQSLLNILQRIENVLLNSGIKKADDRPSSTCPMKHSYYISRRNVFSKLEHAEYTSTGQCLPLSLLKARDINSDFSYNPYLRDDPYAAFDLYTFRRSPTSVTECKYHMFPRNPSDLTTLPTNSCSPVIMSPPDESSISDENLSFSF
ncbi:MAG: hypothetical protein CK424_05855 [Legionella sp.]|nr:MAG: hypothetical protein CK424_05855 [Legionella sp.]